MVPRPIKSKIPKNCNLSKYSKIFQNIRLGQIDTILRSYDEVFDLDLGHGENNFIKAVSDIRSYNYSIDIKDKLEVKKISGNIIPAVSTSLKSKPKRLY